MFPSRYAEAHRNSPDYRAVIISQQQAGNQFAIEWEITGTNDDDSLPATDRQFKLRGVSVGEHAAGKFTLKRDYYVPMAS
jgi:hypothetical protein